jgi:hypothetical protein
MPIPDIVTAMIEERDKLDQAIAILRPDGGRRTAMTTTQRGTGGLANGHPRRGMSPAARKAQSERMRKYWAAKRRKIGAAAKKS